MDSAGAVGTMGAETEEDVEGTGETAWVEGKTSLARPEEGPGEGAGDVPADAKCRSFGLFEGLDLGLGEGAECIGMRG
jgi:hypothetical protein